MTVQELHIAFNIELDKTLDFEYPYISPEQVDYWLNKAQNRFIKQRAFGNNLYKTTFEETEKRIDDLRTLVVRDSANTSAGSIDNTFEYTLPDDYMYLVRHQCIVTSDCGTKTVKGIQVKNDEIEEFNADPFRKAAPQEPLYTVELGVIIYEAPEANFTVDTTSITYIGKPAIIQHGSIYSTPIEDDPDAEPPVVADVTSNLPDYVHNELVDIAIAMVLENIESQRYQTNLNELNKTE